MCIEQRKRQCKYLDLDNCVEFDDQWSSHSGDADIVGMIENKKVDT